MERDQAILIIVENELRGLTKEKREEMLLNWWSIDEEDSEFNRLSDGLQKEIVEESGPLYDPLNKKYDPLILEGLKNKFIGVKNAYLSKRVSNIEDREIIVTGEEEKLFACPCCRYRTIEDRGHYEICPVCFWEDDGSDQATVYSFPNHMTLEQGRFNFDKFGCVNDRLKNKLCKDSVDMYIYEVK
ncbi:Cysteine-rich CPCC [Marininema mesophilum]|uniref:Cysteine-rich CPCC n=1 Tax=Marininema mesophilum TaxID=1048340 RepID=A0A1H2XAU3_9BACL|nr:CPCC family cysteine-rich protein [Marininema mesophilum]SDW89960.1 Cysteine-rich CPCC [Marininema mesophilum]